MSAFITIWSGQLFSLLGSAMTRFALTIWAYQMTGQATAVSLIAFFSWGPEIIMSPIAGAIVDRLNRKLTMALADVAIGLATVAILILYLSDALQLWHVYVAGAFAGTFSSLHWPAYSAAITLMVPKRNYSRATAMTSLAEASSSILAPILAAAMLGWIGIGSVFALDLVTLFIGLSTLLITKIPKPSRSRAGLEGAGSLLKESFFGFRYIFSRPSLLGLQLIFLFGNMFSNTAWIVAAPMILARTGNNAAILATAESAGGIGGVVGGIILSIWGGFRRKTDGVFLGWALPSLFAGFLVGMGQSLPLWVAGFFLASVVGNLNYVSNQAIWQSKVPPDIQGRVFSTRRLIAQLASPIALLAAGPLADRVFEPAMMPGGFLSNSLGPLFGTGPGSGMSFMIFVFCMLVVLVGLSGYLFPVVRDAEKILPDHDAQEESKAI